MTVFISEPAASTSARRHGSAWPRTSCDHWANEWRGCRRDSASMDLTGSPPHCTVCTTSGRNHSR